MTRRGNQAASRLLPAALLMLACTASSAQVAAPSPGDAAPVVPAAVDDTVARGKYISDASNCRTCHTRPGGAPFSGGLPFETPFGTIHSTNITSDTATGIGSWTAADLRRAMHEGVGRNGKRLFPAFPYTSFTRMSDADVDALYAYLRTLKAVRYEPPDNGLLFSQRWPLMLWNALFFKSGRYRPDASQSAEWNRGAYLVEGAGHCGACHTPRNLFMAEIADRAYEGGVIRDRVADNKIRTWSAVNLTSAKSGLAAWSVEDLTRYLHTGFSPRAGTFGPMNEVIVNSLKHLSAEDVRAMSVYLKSLPAREQDSPGIPEQHVLAGEPLYKERCVECHASSGRGGMFSGPPLAGSAIVQSDNPTSLINIILYGPETPEEVSFGAWETMQAYHDVLTDDEVAAVSNYVRGSWGNRGRAVQAGDVARQR